MNINSFLPFLGLNRIHVDCYNPLDLLRWSAKISSSWKMMMVRMTDAYHYHH